MMIMSFLLNEKAPLFQAGFFPVIKTTLNFQSLPVADKQGVTLRRKVYDFLNGFVVSIFHGIPL